MLCVASRHSRAEIPMILPMFPDTGSRTRRLRSRMAFEAVLGSLATVTSISLNCAPFLDDIPGGCTCRPDLAVRPCTHIVMPACHCSDPEAEDHRRSQPCGVRGDLGEFLPMVSTCIRTASQPQSGWLLPGSEADELVWTAQGVLRHRCQGLSPHQHDQPGGPGDRLLLPLRVL